MLAHTYTQRIVRKTIRSSRHTRSTISVAFDPSTLSSFTFTETRILRQYTTQWQDSETEKEWQKEQKSEDEKEEEEEEEEEKEGKQG